MMSEWLLFSLRVQKKNIEDYFESTYIVYSFMMIKQNITYVITNITHGYEYMPIAYFDNVASPLLAGIALILNVITLLVMYAFGGKIKGHYVLVVVQCSADLSAVFSYLMFYLTASISRTLTPPLNDNIYCIARFISETINASFTLSLLNILAMTTDRFMAIHSPLSYPIVARTSHMKIIGLVMAGFSVVLLFTPFLATVIGQKPDNITLCEVYYYHSYSAVYLVGEGLIYLDSLVMIIVYSYIMDQVRRSAISEFSSGSVYRTTVTSFWIIITFMLCYWPDIISNYIVFGRPLVDIMKTLPLMNCIADPLIYAIRLKTVKAGFHQLYRKIRYSSVIKSGMLRDKYMFTRR